MKSEKKYVTSHFHNVYSTINITFKYKWSYEVYTAAALRVLIPAEMMRLILHYTFCNSGNPKLVAQLQDFNLEVRHTMLWHCTVTMDRIALFWHPGSNNGETCLCSVILT